MEFKLIIKEILPPFLLNLTKKLTRKPSANFYCPVCNKKVIKFDRLDDHYFIELDKYQYVHSIFLSETLNIFNYSCPHCYSPDRSRLYAIYLERKFQEIDFNNKSIHLLDVAPDKGLSEWIKKHSKIRYRSVDLFMEEADDHADVTNLNIYQDNSFDIVICSHVLEHIADDNKAISELYRVMKTNGFGIIMVPILLNLESDIEDPEYNTIEKHWKFYGQDDHVRVYSKNGFINKLSKNGFKVNAHGIDYFGETTFVENGIHPRSVLYIVEK